MSFDPRLMRVGIEIGKEIIWVEGLMLEASITKVANATSNDATIKVANMTKNHRDNILTETSPFNKLGVRKRVIVEAGRESYGLSRIFTGDQQESNDCLRARCDGIAPLKITSGEMFHSSSAMM